MHFILAFKLWQARWLENEHRKICQQRNCRYMYEYGLHASRAHAQFMILFYFFTFENAYCSVLINEWQLNCLFLICIVSSFHGNRLQFVRTRDQTQNTQIWIINMQIAHNWMHLFMCFRFSVGWTWPLCYVDTIACGTSRYVRIVASRRLSDANTEADDNNFLLNS